MQLDVVETLCELVRIPSVNPMGRNVVGEEYYEHRVTNYLEQLFRSLGWRYERQCVAPLRENIVARIEGEILPEQGGKLLMLEAHQDTVPVDGMIIPPFQPDVKNGRVYGRGSCDIKGGLASILAAAARFAAEKPAGRPTLLIGCTVNEEHGFNGASALAATWADPQSTSLRALIPRRPDAVIVAEPTLLNVVAAHKGVLRWRCHTHGRAGHSSQPELGENAIYRMAAVLACLERYAQEVVGTLFEHPLVGRPTLSVGVIQGGISVNTVPDHCTIEIDRRIVPLASDEPLAAQRHVMEYLRQHLPADLRLTHEEPFIQSRGLSDAKNGELVARLCQVAQAHGAAGEKIGVPYGTDAPAYDASGIPTVVFGPGSIAQAHTCDEWVEIAQLRAASEIYYQFAKLF